MIDYSTLNIDRLKKLQVYKKPPTYRISDSMGSGCAGDPPGYPSYFVRHVYTQHGNSPRRGATAVITYEGVSYVVESNGDDTVNRNFTFRRLWIPLPEDHPRVLAWIEDRYRHLHNCYLNPSIPVMRNNYHDRMVIYPVPDYKLRSLGKFDPHWTWSYSLMRALEIAAYNGMIQEQAEKIAHDRANHCAVQGIRRFYPDHEPRLDLIKNPPRHIATWWEILSERPTPETCPGETLQWGKWGLGGRSNAHPVNGNWCQVCGYHKIATLVLID
jgi:hypothetical protein